MSRINVRLTTAGGTQSPPLEDHEPMGACSIRGGNAGGIPDRLQRSQYFDLPELQGQEPAKAPTKVEQPREDMSTTAETIPEQQKNLDDLRPAHDPQPWAVLETAPTASGPFKKMGNDDVRSARRA
ncbi:hypothetical protein EDB89DRAFT_1972122 [Lactarius sanguifluus]|nr:hypothetical protein EDB89DRAFT_1972122 [Lactarius sanguifluus]